MVSDREICRAGISLYYQIEDEKLKGFTKERNGNDYLINLIDSPGTSTSPARSLQPCVSLTEPWWWWTAWRVSACRPRPCSARLEPFLMSHEA